MNPNQPPFDNKTLRQAAQAAINRQALIDNISFGEGYLSPMGFAKDTWFYLEEPNPVYDPDLARQLLADAGHPDGIDVSFSVINRPVDSQIAQIVADNLTEVGIRTTIEVLERTAWVDLWSSRGGEIGVLINGGGAIDPGFSASTFDPTALSNFAGYDSPEIVELTAEQDQTTDQEERLRIWTEILEIMIDDAVYVPVGVVPAYGAAAAYARDFALHPDFYLQLDAAWNAE
jgi:peptide/nickel transport system substrate-binding protein